jgi:hypothetical protein
MTEFTSPMHIQPEENRRQIKDNGDGSYTVILTVLNHKHTLYSKYSFERLLEGNLSDRIIQGTLFGELAQPERTPGQSVDDYNKRALTVDMSNIALKVEDLWFDLDFGKNLLNGNGPGAVAVMGKVRPWGPMGPLFSELITRSPPAGWFTLRGSCHTSTVNGQLVRDLIGVVAFDFSPTDPVVLN